MVFTANGCSEPPICLVSGLRLFWSHTPDDQKKAKEAIGWDGLESEMDVQQEGHWRHVGFELALDVLRMGSRQAPPSTLCTPPWWVHNCYQKMLEKFWQF